jgi:uncharacterized RDD family membrane protein YckC
VSSEVSVQKCPSCGGENLITASLCSRCSMPLAHLTQASSLAARMVELRKARQAERDPGGQEPTVQPPVRDGLRHILDREFIRPLPGEDRTGQTVTETAFKGEYHPLAERALEKVNRARVERSEAPVSKQAASTPVEPELDNPKLSPPAALAARKTKRQSSSDRRKIERIEISLNQGLLPFEAVEAPSTTLLEDVLSQGLTAAPLSSRMVAAAIDALFVLGCFLLFLGIVFFLPDFAFLTKSSFLGLAAVLAMIATTYLFLFIATGTQTLGMEYENLKLVSFEDRSPSAKEIGLRVFGSFTSLGCFALGYIWAFFDPDRLTWHDRISKTLIVEK